MKKKKQRDYSALSLIERKGAGAGYHSERGYSRKQKYQEDWLEEEDSEMIDEEKKYIIVQTQSEGEVALTKADTFETTSAALRRYEIMDIPFVKLVEKKEWLKSPARKKRSPRSKKAKKTS